MEKSEEEEVEDGLNNKLKRGGTLARAVNRQSFYRAE
jgi:hypothetical protein